MAPWRSRRFDNTVTLGVQAGVGVLDFTVMALRHSASVMRNNKSRSLSASHAGRLSDSVLTLGVGLLDWGSEFCVCFTTLGVSFPAFYYCIPTLIVDLVKYFCDSWLRIATLGVWKIRDAALGIGLPTWFL